MASLRQLGVTTTRILTRRPILNLTPTARPFFFRRIIHKPPMGSPEGDKRNTQLFLAMTGIVWIDAFYRCIYYELYLDEDDEDSLEPKERMKVKWLGQTPEEKEIMMVGIQEEIAKRKLRVKSKKALQKIAREAETVKEEVKEEKTA